MSEIRKILQNKTRIKPIDKPPLSLKAKPITFLATISTSFSETDHNLVKNRENVNKNNGIPSTNHKS